MQSRENPYAIRGNNHLPWTRPDDNSRRRETSQPFLCGKNLMRRSCQFNDEARVTNDKLSSNAQTTNCCAQACLLAVESRYCFDIRHSTFDIPHSTFGLHEH